LSWLAGALAVLLIAVLAYVNPFGAGRSDGSHAPAAEEKATCKRMSDGPGGPQGPQGTPGQTSATTIADAYWCLYAYYFGGAALDDRQLLRAAFVGFVQELRRRGLDRPMATLPALTGDRKADLAAFGQKYQEVIATLPDDPALREALALVAIKAMVASLHDDHAHVETVGQPGQPGGGPYGFGLSTQPTGGPHPPSEGQNPPLYIDEVSPDAPAAAAGLRPGDIIEAVDDIPPFINGILESGVVAQLYPQERNHDPVRVTIKRPATGETKTVTLTPAPYDWGIEPKIEAKLVNQTIVKIVMPGFFPGVTEQVQQAIADLRKNAKLRGVILDNRNNRGGDPTELGKFLGAFTHDNVSGYECDWNWKCTASRTDTNTPPVNLPLVVLIAGNCASACDYFAANVKDHKLGQLVGDRTAGIASGPTSGFLLSDNKTQLGIPERRGLGPNGEIVAEVGVPPDYFAPLTPADLSAARDPALAKALELLTR
jgi:carboxyl-terminal processing protease